jgi:phosphate transport system substrate-binding protein
MANRDASNPITSPTWILVYAKQTDKAKGQAVTAFLTYLLDEGQTLAKTVDYAPLPKNVSDLAKAQVAKIQIPA